MSATEEVVLPESCDEKAGGMRLPRAWRSSGLGKVVQRHLAAQVARQEAGRDVGANRVREGHGVKTVKPLTVIVIDDDLDQVDLTVMLLQSRGHRAMGSTDGSRAVEMVASEDAAVALLDFEMGEVNGGDACHALRADARTCGVRIVFVSGTPEVEIRRSCTEHDVYLRKPVASEALFKAIESATSDS